MERRFLVFMPIMVVSHPLIGYVFIPTFFISMALFKTKIGEIRYENSSPSFLLVSMINLGLLLGITYTAWYVLSTEIWSGFLGGLIQYSQGIERATTASADVSRRAPSARPSWWNYFSCGTVVRPSSDYFHHFGRRVVPTPANRNLQPGRGGHFHHDSSHCLDVRKRNMALCWVSRTTSNSAAASVSQAHLSPVRDLRRTRRSMGRRLRYRSHDVDSDRSVHLLVAVVLFLVSMQTVSFYDGLHTTGVSGQQSHHEIEGTDWLLENKDEDIAALRYGGYRYVDSIIGPENRSERRDEFPRSFDRFGVLPPRLTTEEGGSSSMSWTSHGTSA